MANVRIILKGDPAVQEAQLQAATSLYERDCGWVVADVVAGIPKTVLIYDDPEKKARLLAEGSQVVEHEPNLTWGELFPKDESADPEVDQAVRESLADDKVGYELVEIAAVGQRPTIFELARDAQTVASEVNRLPAAERKRIGFMGRARVAYRLMTL